MRFFSVAALALTMSCAAAQPAASPPKTGSAAPAAAIAPSPTAPTAAGPQPYPEAARELEAAKVTGTLALYDTQDGVLRCSDVERCRTEAVTPASTFKIPHSMIALETGLVEGPDTVLPWDHQEYTNPDWNQDLSFRDALRYSCLPCYRAIARKVGEAGEREWVTKLGYGNRDTSGGVDKFWIWGGMRISPLEQVDFLRRFDENKLPISERTADIVRDIMTLDVTENFVLRAKTGTVGPPDEPRELAWFVGWLEAGTRRVFFALLIDGHTEGVDPAVVRRPLTERILHARGAM